MTLILRPDLRCPHHCPAAVVEFRHPNGIAEFRCKMHGPLLPPARPLPRINQQPQGVKP